MFLNYHWLACIICFKEIKCIYGISESACKFSSYLSSRQQRVKVGSDKGEWQYLKHVVPQGSVLGPLLFNIFQIDLFYFLVSLCILYNYAYDNTLSKSDKDVKVLGYKLSIASQTAIKWFKDNFMKANAPKFLDAFFSRDKEIEGITINVEGVQLHSNECQNFWVYMWIDTLLLIIMYQNYVEKLLDK